MEKKVIYEVRLSRPVIVIATIAAVGLLAIGVKPLLEATPAFASNQIHKIAICDLNGQCAEMVNAGGRVRNGMSLGLWNFGE